MAGVLIAASAAAHESAAQTPTEPYDPFFAKPQTVAEFGDGSRPFGVAAGDYDGDGTLDLVAGPVDGRVAFVRGAGGGEFEDPVQVARSGFRNAWALAPADVNGDGNLDVVFGASEPIAAASPPIADGEVRAWLGNGDGTFEDTGFIDEGRLLADVGRDAGSIAAADIDGDGDDDLVVGALDGARSVVKVLRNGNAAGFAVETLVSQPLDPSVQAPIYFPAISTQNSPWGLSISDADGDGDADLWVGDRALYVYLFTNDGAGDFSLRAPNGGVPASRTNAYLDHGNFRDVVGFTPALGSGDVNGDGKADLALGLQIGGQAPADGVENDGRILLDVSGGAGHVGFGPVADVGSVARGLTMADANGDGFLDLISGTHEGEVRLLRQLEPHDTDGDGISDYVDNAPAIANAPRLDMNTDGPVTHLDQLDNDFDTVLGDPEDPATWMRLGDPADPDDDNDGLGDGADNCRFVANAGQGDADDDGFGDACDALDERDADADGVPTGPLAGDPGFEASLAAARRWARGETHFVVRIDALSRIFQNEFTQLMTDAATLSPQEWRAKCASNYQAGDPPDPCDPEGGGEVSLEGGKEVPVSLVVIPKQLWTDGPVIDWVNDRNDNPRLEIAQHGTYHFNNVPMGDWADQPDRNFFSCETCGLTEAESFELMKVGYDTLLGDYSNRWVAESGARPSDPKIDWSSSANELITFSPPFNASDTSARKAIAQLGFKGFSASVFEEGEAGSIGDIFTPEGSHHERFDQFGMFHASADVELEPPETEGGAYDRAAYESYLLAQTDDGGLTTWLIEEVEWSGRPCNELDRLGQCDGQSNRENNTVYLPRWQGWMQLLDHIRDYPGGVAMTTGEVALAKGFDNAPTVANPDQADADADGIGDAIDGAALEAETARLERGEPGTLAATLRNGAGEPIAGQQVAFTFDGDGDGDPETYTARSDADGHAEVEVTATRPVGEAAFEANWDGKRVSARAQGAALVVDTTTLELSDAIARKNRPAIARARLSDSDGAPVAGKTIAFYVERRDGFVEIGGATTDAAGEATIEVPNRYVSAGHKRAIRAVFAGTSLYSGSAGEADAYREPPGSPR